MIDRRAISRDISDEAARWVADADAGLLTPKMQAELSLWLAVDPLHQEAYDRANHLWAALDDIEETPGMRPAPRSAAEVQALPARRRPRRRPWLAEPAHRRKITSAAAACAAVAAVLVATDLSMRFRADAMTSVGEQKLVSLPDGSSVHLNTDSAIAYDYSSSGRHIELLKGEASFQVKADPQRPFTVEAHGGTARALGTRFIVRNDSDGATVTVTEHRVLVSFGKHQGVVGEGESVAFDSRHGLSKPGNIEIADAEAWTRGRLIAVNRPLAEVAAELSRYHAGYIHVSDSVATIPVSGNFRTTDPVAALGQLETALGVHSTRLTNRMIFLHK
ncbi:FecR family protein [Sphingobium sp. DN12]|uniref:FecR family protein n=1 Tax=Sphingobium sp. DN12 TaxID=3378073 RepID=UPI003DA433DF